MKSYLCDTNFILRFLLKDIHKQAKTAKDTFVSAKRGELRIYIPMLVFVEADFNLLKIYHFEKPKIVDVLFSLAKLPYIEIEKYQVLIDALLLYHRSSISLVDAIFIVDAQLSGKELLTFDKRLKQLKISA